MKKIIYIASPYSIGDAGKNVHVQMEAAHRIMDLGHCPVVPLLSHFLHLHRPRPYREWIEMDLALIPRVDVVLRLPGESQGADGEVALARERGLPVAFGWEQLEAALKQSEAVGATGSAHVITGQRLTCLISNAHRLLKRRYRSSPLWAMMSDLTGNGSTIAAEICRAAGYDPSQPCGAKYLKAKGE